MSQATLPDTRPSDAALTAIEVTFPDGLLGFPDVTEYVLVDGPRDGLFWLVGTPEGAPRFLLSDPFVFFDGYTLDLSPEQATRIGADEASTVAVLAITIPSTTAPWTANLQGPVVINVDRGLGAQIVLSGPEPSLRQPFQPEVSSAA